MNCYNCSIFVPFIAAGSQNQSLLVHAREKNYFWPREGRKNKRESEKKLREKKKFNICRNWRTNFIRRPNLSASDAELNLPADWNTLRKNATIYYFPLCDRGVCFISHIAGASGVCVWLHRFYLETFTQQQGSFPFMNTPPRLSLLYLGRRNKGIRRDHRRTKIMYPEAVKKSKRAWRGGDPSWKSAVWTARRRETNDDMAIREKRFYTGRVPSQSEPRALGTCKRWKFVSRRSPLIIPTGLSPTLRRETDRYWQNSFPDARNEAGGRCLKWKSSGD